MALVAVYLYEELWLVRALIAVLIARGFSDKQARRALGVSHDFQPRFSLLSRCRPSLFRWLVQIAPKPSTVLPAGLILEGYVTTHTPTSCGRLLHWTCSSSDSTSFYRVRRNLDTLN